MTKYPCFFWESCIDIEFIRELVLDSHFWSRLWIRNKKIPIKIFLSEQNFLLYNQCFGAWDEEPRSPNCLLELDLEPKLWTAAPAPFYVPIKDLKKFYRKKVMVAVTV